MLHLKAQAITQGTPKKLDQRSDHLLIDAAVIGVIEALIRDLKNRKKSPAQTVGVLRVAGDGGLQGWGTRRRLWKLVKKQNLPKCVTPLDLYRTILKISKSWNVIEVAALYRDVG